MSDNKSINRLFSRLRSQIDSNISIENFKRQYFTKFLKEINYMVKNEDLNHRDFDFEELKKRKLWKPLAKIILLKRIEELKNAQVEKKGKKYYVKDLKKTYFGRYIMDRLKFSRRTVLDEKEYEKVVAAIKKLNYEIPIVVQPTETELFFEE
jgi:hypothetical protein